MQHVLIAHRNEDGRHAADRIRGALEASSRVHCVGVDDVADRDLDAAVEAAGQVIVVVDTDWAEEGTRALDDAPGRRLQRVLEAALSREDALLAVSVDDARLPAADALPAGLSGLERVPLFAISSQRWADDVAALCDEVAATEPVPAGPVRDERPRQVLFAAALVGLVVVLGGLLVASRIWFADTPALVGRWVATVDYGRGIVHDERFEFRQAAGEITGSASWHGARRVIEDAVFDGERLSFHIRTHETLGSQRRELRHDYVVQTSGDDALRVDLRTRGGFTEREAVSFEAMRAP